MSRKALLLHKGVLLDSAVAPTLPGRVIQLTVRVSPTKKSWLLVEELNSGTAPQEM